MNLKRAKELAEERGFHLVEGIEYDLDLKKYDQEYGVMRYVDSLYHRQIAELKEDDFVEYYLQDQ